MARKKSRRYEGHANGAGAWNGRTEFYHRSMGKTFVDYEQEPVLIIGKTSWTRQQLARDLGCCHLTAARHLTKHLAEHGITSVNKLYATPPDELLAITGVGTIQVFVAMCALDAVGFDAPTWFGFDDNTVTAATLSRRARQEQTR